MKKLRLLAAGLVLAAIVAGCASFNATVFRSEKLAADASYAAVSAWNNYYRSTTNALIPRQTGTLAIAILPTQAAKDRLAKLNENNAMVWDASRKVGASLAVVETFRLQYATNSVIKPQLEAALIAANGSVSNVVWLVGYFKGQ